MIFATCWARAAAYKRSSARGTGFSSPNSRSIVRILSARRVPPGSRVKRTASPRFFKFPARSFACVVFPVPSIPSKVIKKPFLPWYKQPLPSFYSIPRLSEIRQFFSYFLFSRTAKGAFTVPRSFFIRHYPDQIPFQPAQPAAGRPEGQCPLHHGPGYSFPWGPERNPRRVGRHPPGGHPACSRPQRDPGGDGGNSLPGR